MAKFGWSGPPKGSTATSPHPTLWEPSTPRKPRKLQQRTPALLLAPCHPEMTELNCLGPIVPGADRDIPAKSRRVVFEAVTFCLLHIITPSTVGRVFQAPASSVRPEGARRAARLARKKGTRKKENRAWKEKTRAAHSPPLVKLPPSNRGTSSCGPARAFLRSRWMPVQEQGFAFQVPAGARQYHLTHSGHKTWPGYKRPVRGTLHPRPPRRRGGTTGDHCRVTGLYSTSSHTRRGIALQ